MAPPDTQIESPAEREARVRRKNRRMIPWIITAVLAPFIVLAALMAVILGPALIKVNEIMHEAPAGKATPTSTTPQPITGDFDRDGQPDTASLEASGETRQLVIRGSAGEGEVRLPFYGVLENSYLEKALPGTFKTACGKGHGDPGTVCAIEDVTLSGDVMVYGTQESTAFVAVWDGSTFHEVQISD